MYCTRGTITSIGNGRQLLPCAIVNPESASKRSGATGCVSLYYEVSHPPPYILIEIETVYQISRCGNEWHQESLPRASGTRYPRCDNQEAGRKGRASNVLESNRAGESTGAHLPEVVSTWRSLVRCS